MNDSHHGFPITTVDQPVGLEIVKTIGLCYGNSVRAHHAGADLVASMKNHLGGEIEEYTQVLAQAREQALDRLCAHAQAMGANAVVGLRFATTEIASGAAELLAYGTAVQIRD